jgi:signal transduction histidine kinase
LGEENFEPLVRVETKNSEGKAEIVVTDNGTGIPQHIQNKIFQPFFSTKPSGEGTGLGLSLSFDIVRTNGGELTFETEEGKGSVFRISLPGNEKNLKVEESPKSSEKS